METKATTVGEACVERDGVLHFLRVDSTLKDALHLLYSMGINSAPVVDSLGKVVAFVDYLTILAFLVGIVTEERQSRITGPSKSLHTDDVGMIVQRTASFLVKHVTDKHGSGGGGGGLVTMDVGAPLQEALEYMTKSTPTTRRIAVTLNGKLVNVLSQGDVLRWAVRGNHIPFDDDDDDEHDASLEVEPFAVKATDITIDAFMALFGTGYTGAAVVDQDGALVGSFSSTDLKGIAIHDSFLQLLLPVSKWMRMVHQDEQHEQQYFKLVWVPKQSNVKAIVKRFIDHKLHRIFVVEKENTMILQSVITLTNLLRRVKL